MQRQQGGKGNIVVADVDPDEYALESAVFGNHSPPRALDRDSIAGAAVLHNGDIFL